MNSISNRISRQITDFYQNIADNNAFKSISLVPFIINKLADFFPFDLSKVTIDFESTSNLLRLNSIMAKLVKIFFCVLLICAAINARSITSDEQVPLSAVFELRNIFEGVVSCPEGMVPGMLCVKLVLTLQISFHFFLKINNEFAFQNSIDKDGKCREVWGMEE